MTDMGNELRGLTPAVDEDDIDARDLLEAIEEDDGERYTMEEIMLAVEGLAEGGITVEEFDRLFDSSQSVAAYVDWDHPIDVAPSRKETAGES